MLNVSACALSLVTPPLLGGAMVLPLLLQPGLPSVPPLSSILGAVSPILLRVDVILDCVAPRTVWLACVGRLAFLVCVCL